MHPTACAAAIANCDVVINAAASTVVDKAEVAAATVVNGVAPTEMAQRCTALGVPFLHISTDYAFDGTEEAPFSNDHPTVPLGAYARSKLIREQGVLAAEGRALILRI
jgi:dTDP-4-dehydrorhamnose reductase